MNSPKTSTAAFFTFAFSSCEKLLNIGIRSLDIISILHKFVIFGKISTADFFTFHKVSFANCLYTGNNLLLKVSLPTFSLILYNCLAASFLTLTQWSSENELTWGMMYKLIRSLWR